MNTNGISQRAIDAALRERNLEAPQHTIGFHTQLAIDAALDEIDYENAKVIQQQEAEIKRLTEEAERLKEELSQRPAKFSEALKYKGL